MAPGDRNVAFFRPLWRRVLLVLVLVGWTGVELSWGDALWATITLGILAYSVWAFFLTFPKAGDEPPR